jgi:hypothetical protein
MRSVIGARASTGAAAVTRFCQDHECYWRRLEQLTYEEQIRVREATAPLAKLLWIGCIKGSEGRPRF